MAIVEECGLFGIITQTKGPVAESAYYGLYALQHRGQESCGIVVNDGGAFRHHKDLGLVNDVFTPEAMQALGEGTMATGHVRYGTTGSNNPLNAQPVVIRHRGSSFAFAHNGNLINSQELREALELEGSIFHMTSDTEVIAYTVIKELISSGTVEEALSRAMHKLKGAYSLVILTPSKLLAARDENGFRPLCYGRAPDGGYVAVSESCALDAVGATFVRDLLPGEILVFDQNGVTSISDHCGRRDPAACIFEYIYFARSDSVIDGCSVYEARRRAGTILAEAHPAAADVVIGVPDSGIDAAIGYSQRSGIPYGIGFLKNKYIGRTFISPEQKMREDRVKIKLNPISQALKGKSVVVVDDSIVRGTTSARIVRLIRDAGAREIHMRISSPPFMHPCYYGTDIGSRDALIACRHTLDEIRKIIGADTLGYLPADRLGDLIGKSEGCGYCHACFSGVYPTDRPKNTRKNKFEHKIGAAK